MKQIKGYKVFNPEWTRKEFQYEVGKIYELDGELEIYINGFHFCEDLIECFSYYAFSPENKVVEVLSLGDTVSKYNRIATNRIKIIREISWKEVLAMVNCGRCNSGYLNSGDCNPGDRNSGNGNLGHWNSGHCNPGSGNSGSYNPGDCNSGNDNWGNYNSGNRNSGDYNSGDYNSGNYCTGSHNISNNETGYFCTETHTIRLFDVESDLTLKEWRRTYAFDILSKLKYYMNLWIKEEHMTDEEKIKYPEYQATRGYLKVVEIKTAYKKWWNDLSEGEKGIIKNIPNFNPDKFYLITGIRV